MSIIIDRASLQAIFSIIETDLGDLAVNYLARCGHRRERKIPCKGFDRRSPTILAQDDLINGFFPNPRIDSNV